jgi:hypothetical protein
MGVRVAEEILISCDNNIRWRRSSFFYGDCRDRKELSFLGRDCADIKHIIATNECVSVLVFELPIHILLRLQI